VLLNELLEALLLQVLHLVLLQVQHDLGAAGQALALRVGGDLERRAGLRGPHVLLVVVVLRVHHDLVRHQVGGVEADSELRERERGKK